jgi:alkanesulfonate monooxygenase SsuD/methylene tetrahydromethanopterin reductase-like flavin-dependent oxidoreductase (luciferase family)
MIERLAKPVDTLALLSEALNFDFATKEMDDPFSDDELAAISGLQAIRDRVVEDSGKSNPTVRDFVDFSRRGTVKEAPHFIGNAKQVADGLEDWFTSGAYEDFVRYVVPELQRRGLHQKDYRGATLRENLGLPGLVHLDN